MDSRLEVYEQVGAFAGAVSAWLEEREVENAMLLGTLAALAREQPATGPFMACATRAATAVFAALYRAPNLILSRGPDEAIEGTAARLRELGLEVSGVVGPAEAAERFALACSKERGCRALLAFEQRLYQLTEIHWPAPVPGGMRPIHATDLDLVTDWAIGFDIEALQGHEERSWDEARRAMSLRIDDGNLFGWEAGGQLVAMAGLARATARTITINSVYTPPAHRRNGYATALVAAVSEQGLRRGKHTCVLYTDVANPTSNAIYQRIGYRPVCDARSYRFVPA